MTDSHRDPKGPPPTPGNGSSSVPPPTELPAGAPERVSFAGLIDGRRSDEASARAALAELRKLNIEFDLEQTGGRFSLMPDDAPADGKGFDQTGQAAFLGALNHLLDAAEPGSVESTLRCVLYYEEQVVETLFAVQGGEIRPLSRVRPRQPGEGGGEPEPDPIEVDARRRLLMIVPLLAIVFAFLAWRNGLVDAVLAKSSEELVVDTAEFGDHLQVEVSRSLPGYLVTVTRGDSYPADTLASGEAALENAATPVQRAAVRALLDGKAVWVRLEDDEGQVLVAARLELGPLLTDPDSEVKAKLPAVMSGETVSVSISRGDGQGGKSSDKSDGEDGPAEDGPSDDESGEGK